MRLAIWMSDRCCSKYDQASVDASACYSSWHGLFVKLRLLSYNIQLGHEGAGPSLTDNDQKIGDAPGNVNDLNKLMAK